MSGWHPELGSGAVEYREERPILHFASPPSAVRARIAEDRLRAHGFILDAKGAKA